MCRRKITENKGFTLAESLVSILIMLMVSSIMVAGIPAARSAYYNVILKSNAEVAMSTAIYALRNEMTVANDIKVTDNTTVDYMSGTFGAKSKIYIDNGTGTDKDNNDLDHSIMYQRYAGGDQGKEGTSTKLVSSHASDSRNHLYVTYGGVDYTKGNNYITFNNLMVRQVGKAEAILTRASLSITVL